jgi:ATP-dependent DNA helicase RecQ
VFRQLVAIGLLVVDIAGHGGLRLGPDCRDVLRGERRVELRREEPRRRKSATERAAVRATREGMEAPGDLALFEVLRAKRTALAKAQGVPPYVIFHDTTLLAMAQERPRDLDAFARLPGVGGAKLARYAQTFLSVIAAHAVKELAPEGN